MAGETIRIGSEISRAKTQWAQMYYGPSISDLYRRATAYIDKILKGRIPNDLPVDQPMKFELVFNLKTTKQIGQAIPPNVMVRAGRVIR